MSKIEPITRTRTRARTRSRVREAMRRAALTRDEELVLRLRHGIGEPTSATLEFRGQESSEISAKLAYIEAEALSHLRADEQPEPEGEVLKSAIIDKLRML